MGAPLDEVGHHEGKVPHRSATGEKALVGFFTGQPGLAKDVWGWVSQQKFSPKPTLPKREKNQNWWQNPVFQVDPVARQDCSNIPVYVHLFLHPIHQL